MNRKYIIIIMLVSAALSVRAQDTIPTVDPSKPTNLYTQVNANAEFQSGKYQNLYGVRFNLQYAFNPDNLLLLELPLLYNDRTSSFGVSDMRVRYFNVVKRNISPSFIAIAPFADISIPTGSYAKGLGSSSWSLAGGVVFGLVASKKLALFPGISYIHITKPSSDLIPATIKYASNGVGLQFNASYSFSKTTFIFVNPTPSLLNTNGNWKSYWSGEFNFNKIVKPNKLKMNVSWVPNFTAKTHTFKAGATVFL